MRYDIHLNLLSCSMLCLLASQSYAVNSASETDPALLWTCKTAAKIYSTPVIHDGTLYIGGDDGIFYALDTKTGQEKWRHDSGHLIRSRAIVAGAWVVFNNGKSLTALDRETGSFAWDYSFNTTIGTREMDPWDYFQSSPVLAGDILYICGGNGIACGLNPMDGSLVFHYQTGIKSVIRTSPMIHGGKIYFGDWAGVMYAVDLATATTAWTYPTGAPIQSSPVYHQEAVYFGGRSTEVYSLNSATGALNWKWRDPNGSWVCGTPAVTDGVLYIGGSDNHSLLAFDCSSGNLNWKFTGDYNIFTTPWIMEETIGITTGASGTMGEPNPNLPGSLYIISRQDAAIINRYRPPANIFSTPVIDDGVIYFGCSDGNIYALDQQAVFTKPYSGTSVEERSVLLGTVRTDAPDLETLIPVTNAGAGPDSVFVSLYYQKIEPYGAFTAEPLLFALAPGATQEVKVTIKPGLLKPGSYMPRVIFDSKNNIEILSFQKPFRFKVETGTAVTDDAGQPSACRMLQNYPNPFNSSTSIIYDLPKTVKVTLFIHNSQGQIVTCLADQVQCQGRNKILWQANDEDGRPLSSGVYYCRLVAGDDVMTQKLVVLR